MINGEKSSKLTELVTNRVRGKNMAEMMHNAYLNLQARMNAVFDEVGYL